MRARVCVLGVRSLSPQLSPRRLFRSMRGSLSVMSLDIVSLLVLSLTLLYAPLTVLATEAPLVAFVAPGSLNTMLDAPE